jgi:hypothetical protein
MSFLTELKAFNCNLTENILLSTLKPIPSFILNVIQRLNARDQLSNGLTCKAMHVLTTFPLGSCLFSPDEARSWIQILHEDLISACPSKLSKLTLPKIVKKMPLLEYDEVSPSLLPAPTVQFFDQKLPKNSTEEYIRNGLCTKLFRNKYLALIVSQIKAEEILHKTNYYTFYHACCLSSFIYTEFSKCVIEVANICGKNHITNTPFKKIEGSCWFRLPLFEEAKKFKTVSDFFTQYPMEKGQDDLDDHHSTIQKLLLALDPFLFSSLSDSGESAWIFFEDNRSVNPLTHKRYFDLLCNHFGLLPSFDKRAEFLKMFIALHEEFCALAHEKLKKMHKELKIKDVDPRGVITQILVPHPIAEKVLYLAQAYGYVDHSLDHLPFTDRMKEIITDPWKYSKAQFRILAHHLHNFNSGIIVRTHGYGDFFQSQDAIQFRKKIHAFFLKTFITTMNETST